MNVPKPRPGHADRHVSDHTKRSLAKAATYRLLVLTLDFIAVYLFTGRATIAIGFTLASNVYTTVAYFIHERLWARVTWGARDA